MDNKELYKHRSVAAVIGAATLLLLSNLKKIFRKTWLPVVALSLVGALVTFCLPDAQALHDASAPATREEALMSIVRTAAPPVLLAVAFFGTACWLVARLACMLNGNAFASNLKRALSNYGLLLAVFFGLGIIVFAFEFFVGAKMAEHQVAVEKAQRDSYIISAAVAVACFVLLLPLSYSSMRYIIDKDIKLKTVVAGGYLDGLRHWGNLFMTAFLSGIIALLVALVAYMPTFLLSVAVSMNDFGVIVMGDESGLPAHFRLLAYLTNFFTTFVMAYLGVWLFLVFYYAYGNLTKPVGGE